MTADIERICTDGVRSVFDVVKSSCTQEPKSLSRETLLSALLDDVRPTARRLREAFAAVEEADIPENLLHAMWQGAITGATDPAAHVTGAFFPGLGHMIGGAFAAWRKSDQQRNVVEAYDSSLDAFFSKIDAAVEELIWRILESTQTSGGKDAIALARLREQFAEFDELGNILENADDETDWTDIVERAKKLVETLPDLALAHCYLAQAYFGAGDFHACDVAAYTAHELDPDYIFAAFMFFRARLGKEQIAEAVATADYLLQRWPEDQGLRRGIAANLFDLEDFNPVADVARAAVTGLPDSDITKIISLRAAGVGDDLRTAKTLLLEIVKDFDLCSPEVVELLRSRKDLAKLRTEPEVAPILNDPVDVDRLSRMYFPPSDKVAFGFLPVHKTAAAEGVGSLLHGEVPICYIDDTTSGDGKNGLILTQTRLLWKGFWAEPKECPYDEIAMPILTDEEDGSSGSTLSIVPTWAEDEDDLMEVNVLDTTGKRALYCILCFLSAVDSAKAG
jgi:tetratricopeptide (TPR) repeat protein